MNIKALGAFKTQKERAEYLLQFKITTKIVIVDLDLVCKAFIGELGLPIIAERGETDQQVIDKAKAWLKEKAGQ